MTATDQALPPRHSRFWLFAPFVLLAILALGWSAAWVAIRARTVEVLDAWIAREAQGGREWSCPDRSVGGYPFRIEVVCPSLALRRPDWTASVGRVTALAQVYQPRHIIAEVEGPLRASDGQLRLESTWRLLDASLRLASGGLERLSLKVEAPSFRLAGLETGDVAAAGQRLEAHLRPTPTRVQEGAYDGVARAVGARVPALDAFVGGAESTDAELHLTATRIDGIAARKFAEEAERWREAGGALEIALLSIAKGARRVEAKGEMRLDALHRPAGRLEGSGAGLEGLVAQFLAPRAGALGPLLGALAGGGRATASADAAKAGLKPLPPLRLEDGRVLFGPVTIPGVRLQPLY